MVRPEVFSGTPTRGSVGPTAYLSVLATPHWQAKISSGHLEPEHGSQARKPMNRPRTKLLATQSSS